MRDASVKEKITAVLKKLWRDKQRSRMVLYQKFVCAVVCRLSGAKNGLKTGMKLNIAARGVATTNNDEVIYPATEAGAFRQMKPDLQLHPANQQLFCMRHWRASVSLPLEYQHFQVCD